MKYQNNKAPIFGISRLRIGIDGDGITTLVTFMDCPLHCKYCLNDFCHKPIIKSDKHTPYEGIELLSPQELYDRVKIDNLYFQVSGGGICFGGGEPTLYADFIAKFGKLCKHKWKINIETSLFNCSYSTIELLAPVVDKWIVDIKDMNSDTYRKYTGEASTVLQELSYLDQLKLIDKVTIKVPLIPDFNSEDDINASIEILKQRGFKQIKPIRYIKRLSNSKLQNKE